MPHLFTPWGFLFYMDMQNSIKKIFLFCLFLPLRVEIWLASAVLLIGVLLPDLRVWACIGLLFLWITRWMAQYIFTVRTPIDLAIVGVILCGISALVVSPLPTVTYPQVFFLFLGIIYFYILVNWAVSPFRLRIIQFGLLFLPVIVAMIGLLGLTYIRPSH